jgi:NAD(P)H-hydrate epimerase
LTEYVVRSFRGPLIVDADALTHFAGRPEVFGEARGQVILTPHPGEAARLLGISSREVENDRFSAIQRLVQRARSTVLLKGVRTLIAAPDTETFVNTTGTPALATAGSGDVLAGILVALSASLSPRNAAISAAYLHGKVAEVWTKREGAERGMLAREIADGLPAVLASIDPERAHQSSNPPAQNTMHELSL